LFRCPVLGRALFQIRDSIPDSSKDLELLEIDTLLKVAAP